MDLGKLAQKPGWPFSAETTEEIALPRKQFLSLEPGQMDLSSPHQDHLWVGGLQIFFP